MENGRMKCRREGETRKKTEKGKGKLKNGRRKERRKRKESINMVN